MLHSLYSLSFISDKHMIRPFIKCTMCVLHYRPGPVVFIRPHFFCIFRGPKHHGRQFGRPFGVRVGQPNSSFTSQQKLLWPGFSVSSPCFDSGQPCLKGRPPLQAREYIGLARRPARKLAQLFSQLLAPPSLHVPQL